MTAEIKKIIAEEVLDSRGKPTIKVTVTVSGQENIENGKNDQNGADFEASFAVPSGASTGAHEAHELRDNDPSVQNGLGVKKAIANVGSIISPALTGLDAGDQSQIDKILIELDGTPNKDHLGGNTLIGVSAACAKAAAAAQGMEVFEHLRTLAEIKPSRRVPFLFMNLINGGKHASSRLAFQEYQVIPQTENVSEAIAAGIKIQKKLGEILSKEIGPAATKLGDEGGFAPDIEDVLKPLEFLTEAITACGLTGQVKLGLDVAASSFYENGKYTIGGIGSGSQTLAPVELLDYYRKIVKNFDVLSIEDPFQEEDFAGFANLRKEFPDLLVIGDDLTVTNPRRLEKAINGASGQDPSRGAGGSSGNKSVNALIIKPNQVGTLSETLETMRLARDNDVECIVSHRSGETMDNFIADLAFAFGCFGLKAGAPGPKERMVKYERLKKIAAQDSI